MKLITAISAAALVALSVPAFAQANSDQTTTKPNGTPGVTSGADPKGGSLTEGRSSVNDPMYNNNSGMNSNNTTTKPNGTPGNTSGTDPK